MAWNEPNNLVFLKPQFRRTWKTWAIQSARDYAKICNATSWFRDQVGTAELKVACGVISPRGNNNPKLEPPLGPAPLFPRDEAGGADGFDVYATTRYYGFLAPPPPSRLGPWAASDGGHVLELDVLIREIDRRSTGSGCGFLDHRRRVRTSRPTRRSASRTRSRRST